MNSYAHVGQGAHFGRSSLPSPLLVRRAPAPRYVRIGQAVGPEQYPRMRCRSACDLFADQGPYSGIIARLTPLTTFRVYDQLPNGWSRVGVEGGPFGERVGLIRSENLVLVPSGGITLPGQGPVASPPNVPGTGPFVPGRPIDVSRPTIPSPLQPLPTPPPDTSPPPADTPPADTAPPATDAGPIATSPEPASVPWYESPIGALLLLSSPLWGAVLLSKLLPTKP